MPEGVPTDAASNFERLRDQADMVPIIERVAGTMVGATVSPETEFVTPEPSPRDFPEQRNNMLRAHPEMHPYLPAERLPKRLVRKFYDITENTPGMAGWRGIDVLLAKVPNNGDIEHSFAVVQNILDAAYAVGLQGRKRMSRIGNYTSPGERQWHDVAMLRASLPAFRDRIEGRQVSDASAKAMYRSLTREVMPFVPNDGTMAEIILAALLARCGGAAVAFPGSTREEDTRLKNEHEQSFNHDFYQLVPGLTKIPLQVKKSGHAVDPNAYDAGVVQIHLVDWLLPVLLGPNHKSLAPWASGNSARFLEFIRNMFHIPTTNGNAMLDIAAQHVHDRIREQAVERGIIQG